MRLAPVAGAAGFLLVVGAPWQVTIIVTALVAGYVFLIGKKAAGPALTREEIARQERNAAYPRLLQVANFGVALSGALLIVSFIGSFVMFMNAREQAQRLGEGHYRASTFRVLQTYWQKGRLGTARGSTNDRASARGLVDGQEEWMDLQPVLGFIAKDQATVARVVPPGTEIPVYYDPELRGDYRVRFRGNAAPGVASRNAMPVIARYGAAALLGTGVLLLAFLRLRRFSRMPLQNLARP